MLCVINFQLSERVCESESERERKKEKKLTFDCQLQFELLFADRVLDVTNIDAGIVSIHLIYQQQIGYLRVLI